MASLKNTLAAGNTAYISAAGFEEEDVAPDR
jgi:hypothetical protein